MLVSLYYFKKLLILNANTTSRPLLHLRVCSLAIWQPVVHPNSLWWSSVMVPTEAMHLWGTEDGLFMASGK